MHEQREREKKREGKKRRMEKEVRRMKLLEFRNPEGRFQT